MEPGAAQAAETPPAPVAAPPRRALAGGALVSLTVQVVTLGSAALTSIVVARAVGPSGLGITALAANLFGVLLLTFGIGLGTGLTFVVSRGGWSLGEALRRSTAMAALLGAVGGVAAAGLYMLTRDSVLDGLTPLMMAIVAVALPFGMAWKFASSIALAAERYEAYGAILALQAGLALIATTVLVLAAGTAGAVAGLGVSYVLAAICAWIWLMRHPGDAVATAEHEHVPLREARRFGLRTWSADLLQLVNYRLDFFVLNAYAASIDVGRYALAISLVSLGWVLPTAMQTVLFPRTASLDAVAGAGAREAREADDAVVVAIRHTAMMLIPTAVVLAVLLVVGIPLLWGAEFDQSVTLGFLLLPGVLAIGMAKVFSAVITGRGKPIYSFYNSLIVMPLTVGLYFLLIPRFDATGAAIASSMSYIASTLLAVVFFKRVSHIRVLPALRPSRAVLRDYAQALANLREYARATRRALVKRPREPNDEEPR